MQMVCKTLWPARKFNKHCWLLFIEITWIMYLTEFKSSYIVVGQSWESGELVAPSAFSVLASRDSWCIENFALRNCCQPAAGESSQSLPLVSLVVPIYKIDHSHDVSQVNSDLFLQLPVQIRPRASIHFTSHGSMQAHVYVNFILAQNVCCELQANFLPSGLWCLSGTQWERRTRNFLRLGILILSFCFSSSFLDARSQEYLIPNPRLRVFAVWSWDDKNYLFSSY